MRQPWLWLDGIVFWFEVRIRGGIPRQGGLRLLKKSDKFLAFFVFWRKIRA